MKEPARSLLELLDVIESLRGPDGCPWDQEQELSDIGQHLLEEVCEVLDAISDGGGRPTEHVCEELGDVLMNVFMASVIASEDESFDLSSVATGIRKKLVRRHPHVFGDKAVKNSGEVLKLWNSIKEEERKERDPAGEDGSAASILDRVPRSLPSVQRAEKISKKASSCGLDWVDANGVIDKLKEEVSELEGALSADADGIAGGAIEEELGDILFTAVNLCRKLGYSADEALVRSTRKFTTRFKCVEMDLGTLEGRDADELNAAWDRVKGSETDG
jgi:MazG family protein